MKPNQVPQHLSPEMAEWWKIVVGEYQLESHHVRLLTLACESWDRCTEARKILAEEGVTYIDRFGAPRQHPACAIERDNKISFSRLLRELGLDLAEIEPLKPPIISAKRGTH